MLDKDILSKSLILVDRVDFEKSYVHYLSNKNHIIELYLLKEENVYCPKCFKKGVIIGSKSQEIKASTIISNNTIIKLHRRVYKCECCGSYFKEDNPVFVSGKSISVQKEYEILEELKNVNATFSGTAKRFNVSPTYVTNLFDSRVNARRLTLPSVLCIDEVYTKKLVHHSYCFILYSPQWRKIIDVLDSRRKLDLIEYFARISYEEKQNVKYVSMDLYDTYRQTIKKCLPNVVICADPFHVVKNLNIAFQNIRIRTMKHFEYLKSENSNYYWIYKKFWKLLLKDISKFKDGTIYITRSGMELDKYQIIEYMLKLNHTLRLAYELKEDYRNFVATATIDTAKKELDMLIEKFKEAHISEYASFISLLKNWYNEIINSFNTVNGHKITNGPMERVNSDIKTIIRISYGSTNFIRMRNRFMFSINKDIPILSIKGPLNKRNGASRGKYHKKTKEN